MNEKPEPVKVTCDKCDYTWYTRSTMKYVTCPNCRQKTRNPREGE